MTIQEFEKKFLEKGVNLNWLAVSCNLNYSRMIQVAKKPIVGQPYDPDKLNFEEIEKYAQRNNTSILDVDLDSYEPKKSQKAKNVEIVLNATYTLDDGEQYTVVYNTSEDVALERMNKLRCMSIKRFVQLVKLPEEE